MQIGGNISSSKYINGSVQEQSTVNMLFVIVRYPDII